MKLKCTFVRQLKIHNGALFDQMMNENNWQLHPVTGTMIAKTISIANEGSVYAVPFPVIKPIQPLDVAEWLDKHGYYFGVWVEYDKHGRYWQGRLTYSDGSYTQFKSPGYCDTCDRKQAMEILLVEAFTSIYYVEK